MSENIVKFIKEKRKQLKLTQPELAERAGVGLRFVRELEQDGAAFTISCEDLPAGTYHLYIDIEGGQSIAHKTIQIVR